MQEVLTDERRDQTMSLRLQRREVLPDGSNLVVLIGLIATTHVEPIVETLPILQRV